MVAGVMTHLGSVRTTEIGQPAAKLLRAAVFNTAYGEGSETKWRWAGGAVQSVHASPA